MNSGENTDDLLALGGLLAFLRQGIKIVSFFSQQPFANQPLDDIKHGRTRFRIVAARFKQLVEIECVPAPVGKAAEHFPG